jgi:hypothetical protein
VSYANIIIHATFVLLYKSIWQLNLVNEVQLINNLYLKLANWVYNEQFIHKLTFNNLFIHAFSIFTNLQWKFNLMKKINYEYLEQYV